MLQTKLKILVGAVVLPFTLLAQIDRPMPPEGSCGTVFTQENQDYLEKMQRAGYPLDKPLQKSTDTYLFPITHYIITKDDGSGGIPEANIEQAMERTNAFFIQNNMQFYRCGPYVYIASSEWYDFQTAEESAMRSGNYDPDVINVYWVDNIESNSICGYASYPGGPQRILMANPCHAGKTFEHELGHHFNLYHTHGKSSGGGMTDEYVDGTDCATRGDNICDTPADPTLSLRVDPACNYSPESPEPLDGHGDPFNPDPTNIMAYSPNFCRAKFTQGQWDRVSASLATPARSSYFCSTPPCVLRSFATTDESSYGAYDGTIDMTILGSTGPYTIVWTGPNGFTANTEDISGLTAGRYYLDITDVTGCNQIDSVDIFFEGCAPDEVRALVIIETGSYAEDISWEIRNSFNIIVASGTGYEDNDVRVDTICLTHEETFTFYAYDAYGDGWGGTYEVRCGGTTILANNDGNMPNNGSNTNSMEIESQEVFVNDICSPIDLSVIEILSPHSTCNLTNKERVRVRVMNYGAMPIEDFSLGLGINGVAPTIEAVSRRIGSYESVDYTFNTFADLSNVQVHSILADADALGDLNTGNDAAVKLVEKEPIAIGSFPYQNDFESGLDVLIQSVEDDLDWIANSGSTPSNLTGPSSDHTTLSSGGNGVYYYVEAGALGNTNSGKKAILQSPCVDMSFVSGPFLSFWYHMYGTSQGKLALEINVGSQGWIEVWSQTGANGNSWNFVDVDMSDYVGMSIKFRFVGTVGNGYLSDIAIDDIEFRNETVPLNANIVSADNISCKGLEDGYATVNSYGGTPPHTYLWSTGGTEQTEENLAPGTHSVTVTDFEGITLTVEITLSEPDELFLLTESIEDILCAGSAEGEICILGNGGTPPYTYSIDGGANFGSNGCFTNLLAGAYAVQVKDRNGCITIDTLEVIEPPVFSVLLDSNESVHCYGESSGFASAFATGGVLPYTYLWSNGGTDTLVNNLVAGTNYVIVEDANGCQVSVTFSTPQAPKLNATPASIVNLSCPGGNDGSASLSITGGTPPYEVEWLNTGTMGMTDSNLSAGTYSAAITDSLGCQLLTEVTISEPVAIGVTKSSVMTTCYGCANGEASVVPSGGTPPYTYLWPQTGGTDSVITDVLAGVYEVQITDANNCVYIDSVEVVEPAELSVLLVMVNDVGCYGESTGTIVVEAIGGVPPYTYSWSNGKFGPMIDDLSKGVYTVTVTDDNNNQSTLPVAVDEASPLEVDLTTLDDASGNCTGAAVVTVSGGTPPYRYFWDDPVVSEDSVVIGLCEGTYNLIVMDDNFCSYPVIVDIKDGTIGLEEVEDLEGMRVYPNPTDGIMKVRFSRSSTGQLQVSNLLGEIVYVRELSYTQHQVIEIDLSAYPSGVYSVQLTDDRGRTNSKILKQ